MNPIYSMRRLLGYEDNQGFQPYFDAEIDMRENPYQETYLPKNKVRDKELDRLVSRTLMNGAISLAEETQDKRGIPEMYKYRSNEYPTYIRPVGAPPKRNQLKSNKSRSGSRRSKERNDLNAKYARDAPPGSDISVMEGVPMITLPLPLLKQYMLSEVDARVRGITDHYEKEHGVLNRDRMSFLAEIISLRKENRTLVEDARSLELDRELMKVMFESAANKTAAAKAAKRKRRRDRKTQHDDVTSQLPIRRKEDDCVEQESNQSKTTTQGNDENEATAQGAGENETATANQTRNEARERRDDAQQLQSPAASSTGDQTA